MDCFSGLGAAAAAAGAANSFSYNRENFQGDREQRRRASVKMMSWRVEQAKLWRQDVRDLISLTEYKMHMYLIVNVLVLGFTIFLYTEGRLPSGTPQWLMLGNVISIGTAFMFLLLSIWLAMHAAISAQSFEARLLTQMVRLPIPTWEEVEATRTYGSEFEKMEGRQMFRVPWLMGWQENLVGGPPPPASGDLPVDNIGNPDIGNPPLGHIGNPDIGNPPLPESTARDSDIVGATAGRTPNSAGTGDWNVDPWGLEQAAEGMPELGCGLGSDVAKLRHVKLARQAAIQFQTYDAFSRISMSIGVQQLMQAMSYYMLGYLLVQVGSKTAAVLGVILFTMMANTTVRFDMSLAIVQLRLVQFLLIFGPVCSTAAALAWADFEANSAEFIVPIAFISHGLYFALVAAFCRVRVAENGAWLPVAFRSVLYLDVFSWTRGQMSAPSGRESRMTPAAGAAAGRPALQSVRYVDGLPVPSCPQDMAPDGISQDLRDAPGAPQILRPASGMEGRDESFYNPTSFLPVEDDAEDEEDEGVAHKQGWDEKVGPGELPWRVFSGAMLLVSFLWLGAAVYCVHGAKTNWSLDLSIKEIRHHRKPQDRPNFVGPEDIDAASEGAEIKPLSMPWWDPNLQNSDDFKTADFESWSLNTIRPLMFAQPPARGLSFLAAKVGPQAASEPEQIMLSWPWPNIAPSHLTCDVSGSHFVVADRVLMFSATIAADTGELAAQHRAAFEEVACPAVLGEGLEDVAITCNSTKAAAGAGCEVLALHRHGRRLAACGLGVPRAASHDALLGSEQSVASRVEEISDKWLENSQRKSSGVIHRSRIEKALSISVNPECKGEVGAEFCTVLGTTHGRVVQLGRHSSMKELIPTEVLYEESRSAGARPASTSGIVRAFNRRYLGVLQQEQGSIHVLDLSKGGLLAAKMPLPLRKPVASFCAGGGNVYMLTRGPKPELWRIPVPHDLRPDSSIPSQLST